jgi:hypothetical protein
VTALVGIADALAGPGSTTIEWRCGRTCPDRARLLSAIDPLVPRWDVEPPRGACQDDIRCHRLLLPHPVCGAWPVEVRMADSVDYRLELARIGELRQGDECRGGAIAAAGSDRAGTP